MSLPNLFLYKNNKHKQKAKDNDLENITKLRESFNPFANQMQKISEIKLYLKYTLNKTDINNDLISDIEREYAIQFLTKMDFLPTKINITKILKLRPIEQCEFHLSIDSMRNKQLKCLHIYPNAANIDKVIVSDRLTSIMLSSPEELEAKMNKEYTASVKKNQSQSSIINKIKHKPISKDEKLLYNREGVDDLITKAKDDILDKRLYAKNSTELNNEMNLSIENIMPKYIQPSKTNILKRSMENKQYSKIRLKNIKSAQKDNVINNPKYQFPLLSISFDKEIIEEINQPIDIPIEIIMKDVNYILDNFPIKHLLNYSEGDNNNGDTVTSKNMRDPKLERLYTELKLFSKEEVLTVYKVIQSKKVYRIIGITINLIYWIVFGMHNRIQIDNCTKSYLLIKLLKEKDVLLKQFDKKKLYHTLFIPLLIIVLRLECENVFNKKFKKLFEVETSKQIAFDKVNEVITAIYDPEGYHNTFGLIGGNIKILRHQLNKNLRPSFKNSSCSTSTMVNQLFTSVRMDNSPDSNSNNNSVTTSNRRLVHNLNGSANENINDEAQQKKVIAQNKEGFYRDMLLKINRNLMKRNLMPIFNVSNSAIEQK